MNKEQTNTTNKNPRLSACTEAYKEHIMYTFNAFCKVVIRYATINSWRDRGRRRKKEISFEYLTEEKFYPLSTTDEYFTVPYEEYPVTIFGQTIILTNEEPEAVEEVLQHYSKRIWLAPLKTGISTKKARTA